MEEGLKISLKAARVNAELSQAEAARRIGIDIETLRRYEQGKTAPRTVTMTKIEKVYGLDRRYIKTA